MKEKDYIDYLLECTVNVEVSEGFEFLLHLAATEGEEYVSTFIIDGFLLAVGDKWKEGEELTLADTYVSSKIIKLYLEKLSENKNLIDPNKKAIFGNIKNDFQSTGRKLVIRFLEMDGWDIIDLGNDIEPAEFIKEAKEHKVNFIGVSAMLYENAKGIKDLVNLIETSYSEEEEKPVLVAGGAIFNVVPDLAEELSVKHTASNAYEAKEVFADLYRRSVNV